MTELMKLVTQDNIQIKMAFQFQKYNGTINYFYLNSVFDGMNIYTHNQKSGVLCKTTF